MTNETDSIELMIVNRPDDLPSWLSLDDLTQFFHHMMKPWHDTPEDVRRGLDYALDDAPGRGGFAVLAIRDQELLGGTVFLETGMQGYIPENLLLFIAVRPELRSRGIGHRVMERAVENCKGSIKLHVEHENPARHLYERIGMVNKYLEYRLDRS